ncbi:Glyoxalase/Bleomycin resistance protein/Dioxygenase superfamily protein [Cohnella sp. OV330]|nr:Glyoxalase/Bleomycin resistance protein/Dioxygenase superfamily protein [Cohnella sp. OV330]
MNVEKNLLGNKTITQIGLVVRDIEKTSQAYAGFFGVDKPAWFWTDAPEVARTEYGGQPSQARAKLAFFDMGSLQLELIEPDEHPSTWRESLERDGEGFHHIAFVIEGMQQKIELLGRHGHKLLQKGEYTGGRYAYMDTSSELKLLVELLENDR